MGDGDSRQRQVEPPGSAPRSGIPDAELGVPDLSVPLLLPPDVEDRIQILVADDNAINRHLVRALLAPLDCRLTEAGNGLAAVEAVKRQRYDLVLMDMRMPVMDGPAAIEAIRALPDGRQLPIIALTANTSTAARNACLDAGADAFLTKPLDAATLIGTVEAFAQTGGKAAG